VSDLAIGKFVRRNAPGETQIAAYVEESRHRELDGETNRRLCSGAGQRFDAAIGGGLLLLLLLWRRPDGCLA
jgi:hypothetical protein